LFLQEYEEDALYFLKFGSAAGRGSRSDGDSACREAQTFANSEDLFFIGGGG
jgi:hypothetical protein